MAMANSLSFLGIVFLSCSMIGASRDLRTRRSLLVNGGSAVFDITKYGAIADGKTDNNEAITHAWIAACKNSTVPATVLIPKGTFLASQTLFAGPCTSPKPITVEVVGTLKASTDMSEYYSPEWFTILKVDGFVLKGNGVFDGQGAIAWPHSVDCKKTNYACAPLPASLKFDKVTNAVVTGITSLNSMWFHLNLFGCSNIAFSNLKIIAPDNSPNTDGIHTSTCDRINITNSIIGTGDDCISIGHSSSNIAISNIVCGPGHGISVGSLGKRPQEKSVNGITVRNCTFINTTNGARIKTWLGTNPGEVKNIVYENLVMNGVKNPIIIDQSYGGKKKVQPSTSVWKISDVHFRNIRGTTVSNVAVSLQCSKKNPCEGMEVANIDLAYAGRPKNTTFVSSCANAKVIFGGKLNPPKCL